MAPIHVHLQMGPFQELEAESGSARNLYLTRTLRLSQIISTSVLGTATGRSL